MTTYKRIGALEMTRDILRFIADQRVPVTGREVAEALNIQYGTVMCHLATHEDGRFVRRVNDKYELGPEMAYMWARYKTGLEAKMANIDHELKKLKVED